MKFFKNTVAIIALFAIGSALGKATASRGGAKPTAQTGRVTQRSTVSTATQTYPQLVAFVKNQRNVWDARANMLANPFVQTMIDNALAADLDAMQFDALLQTARDYHAQFPNDQAGTIAILNNLEAQRKDSVDAFESRKAMQERVDLGGAL